MWEALIAKSHSSEIGNFEITSLNMFVSGYTSGQVMLPQSGKISTACWCVAFILMVLRARWYTQLTVTSWS